MDIFDYSNAKYNDFGPEEYLEHQVRVHGLDTDEFYRLMRRWFEDDDLLYCTVPNYREYINAELNNRKPDLDAGQLKQVKKDVDQVEKILAKLEEKIREDLFVYAEELEQTRARSVHTVAGFISALKVVTGLYSVDKEKLLVNQGN